MGGGGKRIRRKIRNISKRKVGRVRPSRINI